MTKHLYHSNKEHKFNYHEENGRIETIRDGLRKASLCPSMELLAVITNGNRLIAFRNTGQRIWDVGFEGLKATALCWHQDGHLLVVGFESGELKFVDSSSGHVVEQRHASRNIPITMITWKVEDSSTFFNQPDFSLDPISYMPLLGTLPSSSKGERIFSSKAIVEFFKSSNPERSKSQKIELLSVLDEEGIRHINMFSSYKIGEGDSLHSALNMKLPKSHHICRQMAYHVLHCSDQGHSSLQTLHMPLLEKGLRNIVDIATMSTKMQLFVRYIEETVDAMYEEFKNIVKAENSLRNSFTQIFEKHKNDTFSPELELYQFIMNGLPTPILKEWLTERVGDRVLKNWEKLIVNACRSLSVFCQEFVIPASERLGILLNLIRGKAIWGVMKGDSLLDPKLIDDCMSSLSSLQTISFTFLSSLQKENAEMKRYVSWLNYAMHEFVTTEPATIPPQDIVDHIQDCVRYIRNSLMHSQLTSYFVAAENSQETKNSKPSSSTFQDVINALRLSFDVIFSYPSLACRSQWTKTANIKLLQGNDWLVSACLFQSKPETSIEKSIYYKKNLPGIYIWQCNLQNGQMLPSFCCHFELDASYILQIDQQNTASANVLDAKVYPSNALIILAEYQNKIIMCEVSIEKIPFIPIDKSICEMGKLPEYVNTIPIIPVRDTVWTHSFNDNFSPSRFDYIEQDTASYGIVYSEETQKYRWFNI
ncbi:anaphase-promoting complex, platform subcomplex scaffold subunit Apc4/Cut20 [Schizosaccharomyces osmophilus]|uniref:Anaphase-promoting complex subunit 4 n=1 Tax=Schizosaccharomyces osmophilus TaxID=2545709 RepID=A0AAF0B023_9SCHI|nr:anaphase-promoting complex, platform subcomplex scaffold subunit Apc4/Cut20 [Schizosaccharomyces osmophilus]WBW75483.1 anaphase-promoting complex, platform subcomplex scaffold subunit Apc4/Cut20 [Schizosaccharomyces osmophilus]